MNKVSDNGNAAPVRTAQSGVAQGILVLGMHRSGTSACTRVLNLLGCALSSHLLGGGEGNETGHWESIEAVALDDEMLTSAGSSHDDWGPINNDWRESAVRSQMVVRASEVLADHAKLGPLFAIKDPRMCRLADVWVEAAAKARVEPLVLLMLRNPAEVAASLEARDLMTVGYGELLWLRHVLDAEFFTRGQKRAICRYDQLLGNWQGQIAKIKSELSIAFPRNSPKVQAEISQFLSQAHRHHTADAAMVIDNPNYSAWLRQTFQIMVAWSERGEDAADYPVLDKVRTELNHSYGAFAKLLLTRELTGAVGSGGQLRGELTALREENERKTEALRVAADTAERASDAAAERETGLAAELSERTAELASVQSALDESHAEAGAERQRRTEAEERLIEASGDLHQQQLRNAELVGQVAASQSALVQRQEELAQLLNQFREADRVRVRAEAECEQERVRRIQSEQQMASAEAKIGALQAQLHEARRLSEEITQLREAVSATQVARSASERKLADRFNELTQLTAIVSEEAGRADKAKSDADWLRAMCKLEEGFPTWWAILPQTWRQRRVHRRYRNAGLFDAEAYLQLYPDVNAEAMDPVRHYILHGMVEGRTRTSPS